MPGLMTVKMMAERYGCGTKTARKYLRQCVPHMEDPLVAPIWAVQEWEETRTVIPQEAKKKPKRIDGIQRTADGRVIVPR
ncbi:MAG: hypothetical protein IJT00_02375, partial [Lachnospiraceae bacterium]|nr:hypothetical protein [Lachnospiraceae bacterium]